MRAALAIIPATLLIALLPAAAPAAARTTIKTRHGSLGTFLVDGHGRTLYLFMKDKTRRSRCNGPCAEFWPPVLTHGKPKARGHARRSKLSTSRRRDGSRQVVYAGHPLYRFTLDRRRGQTRGEGIDEFGARWYVVAPSGRRILPHASAPPPYSY